VVAGAGSRLAPPVDLRFPPAVSAQAPDEFDTYLAQRRRRRRTFLVVGVLVFIGIVAVPYAFMQMGKLEKDKFEIFVAADILVAIGLIRGLVTHLRDSVWL
jgi:hypothetical protein